MNKSLYNYLQKLSRSGVVLDFVSITFRYGEFTMYCLVGPEENILHLTFASARHAMAQDHLSSLNPHVRFTPMKQEYSPLHAVFQDYFTGKLCRFPIKINSPFIDAGTHFQKRVWGQIGAIPYGKCITYQKLAEMAGSPRGARAAGMACGANPLALLIPCHRVIAANGLGGFAGGLAIKKSLLGLEHSCEDLPDRLPV